MQTTVIGCAGSFPGPDSPASCYLLEAEGYRLVMDFGNGSLGVLQRFVGLFGVDAICLSHLHADHCVDLAVYLVARQWAPGGPRPPIPVYGPRGTAERIAGFGCESTAAVQARFAFHDLAPGAFEIGPFLVIADHVNHPVETFGFRVEHDGWRLAYSADTGECDTLVRLAKGADLLICEASYLDGPAEPGKRAPHRAAGGRAGGPCRGRPVAADPLGALEQPGADAGRSDRLLRRLAVAGLLRFGPRPRHSTLRRRRHPTLR